MLFLQLKVGHDIFYKLLLKRKTHLYIIYMSQYKRGSGRIADSTGRDADRTLSRDKLRSEFIPVESPIIPVEIPIVVCPGTN